MATTTTTERLGNRVAQLLTVVAIVVAWSGLMILAVNAGLRNTARTFAGTLWDAPLWVGIGLIPLSLGVGYVAKQIGVRYGTYPAERGWF